MNIKQYISEVLYKHDSVILPNFGGFITIIKNSEWEHGTQTLFPPKKIISFNDNLRTNDGLLAHYISKVNNISIIEAQQALDEFVRELKNHIQRNEIFSFPGLGTLQYTTDERYIFKPELVNFYENSFGLLPATSRVKANQILETKIQHVEHFIKINNEAKKSKKYWYYGAAAILVFSFILAGQIIYNNIYKTKDNWNEAGLKDTITKYNDTIVKKEIDNKASEIIESKSISKTITADIKADELSNVNAVTDSLAINTFEKKNMIVFGSFYSSKPAFNLCKKLKQQYNLQCNVIKSANTKYYKSVIIIKGSRGKAFNEMYFIKENNDIDAFVSTEWVKIL